MWKYNHFRLLINLINLFEIPKQCESSSKQCESISHLSERFSNTHVVKKAKNLISKQVIGHAIIKLLILKIKNNYKK